VSFAESYDAAADGFADLAAPLVYGALAAPLADVLGAPAADGTMLDVAAGSGALGGYFQTVVALDLSPGQLRRNPAAARVLADAARLPFPSASFPRAGCAFGINNVDDPAALVREMARVAPVVGVSTWRRPEARYEPKEIVYDALERQVGSSRSEVGVHLDRLTAAVGTAAAVTALLQGAGLAAEVAEVEVDIPWPGASAYLGYRLAMPATATPHDVDALRADVLPRLEALSPEQRAWRPGVIIGVGRR
jgi:SAM-dependent methyltransferase